MFVNVICIWRYLEEELDWATDKQLWVITSIMLFIIVVTWAWRICLKVCLKPKGRMPEGWRHTYQANHECSCCKYYVLLLALLKSPKLMDVCSVYLYNNGQLLWLWDFYFDPFMMHIYTMHYSSFGYGLEIKHMLQLLPTADSQK